jgi:hypothetical protein
MVALNVTLTAINVFYIVRLLRGRHDPRTFEVVQISPNEAYLKHLLHEFDADIQYFNPGVLAGCSLADIITPGRSCEKFSKSSEPESAATPSPAPGSACEASSWSRRENRLPRNYLGAEAPFRHLVLTTTAWPLRASRDTPALLARLV